MSRGLAGLMVASLVLAEALSAAPLAKGGTLAEPMPQTLRIGSQSETVPSWVDASRVLTPAGEIDGTLFDSLSGQLIALTLQQREVDGCIATGAPIRTPIHISDDTGASLIPSRSTLDEAFRASELVFEGEVTGRSYGFSGSIAGQLLRLVPVKTFKDTLAVQRQYFVFLPIGRVKVGDKTICKVDPSYPEPPALGDRVVILLANGFREDNQYLSVPDAKGIVVFKKDGSVSLPEAFRPHGVSAPLSIDKFVSHLDSLAREGAP